MSPIIDNVPANVLAKSSAAVLYIPPGPNASLNTSWVSSTVYFTPSLKPSIALIPLSLNKSAALIPALKDLCICSAVVLKSIPATAATLPVIFIISANPLASPATVARLPEPAAISPRENGTVAANLFNSANAKAPSWALPNKYLNLKFNDSTSLPTATKPLIILPIPTVARAPIANLNAVPKLKLDFAVCLIFELRLPKAFSFLIISSICSFCLASAIIFFSFSVYVALHLYYP